MREECVISRSLIFNSFDEADVGEYTCQDDINSTFITLAEPQREAQSVPVPSNSDTVPIPNNSDTVPVPNNSDTVSVPNNSDTVPVPNNSDTVPVPNNSDTVKNILLWYKVIFINLCLYCVISAMH